MLVILEFIINVSPICFWLLRLLSLHESVFCCLYILEYVALTDHPLETINYVLYSWIYGAFNKL